MFKIFIEKTQKEINMGSLSQAICRMNNFRIILLTTFLLLNAFVVKAQTTFNGELFAEFASPVGATFKLFYNGNPNPIAVNQDGYIDFGDLSYNSTIGFWVPSQMCPNPFTYCYRLTVNMEPWGVMGDFDLNLQYTNTQNPNASAGFPYSQRHGLGRKVAATIKAKEVLPGSNGVLDIFDLLNLGAPSNQQYAVLLDQVSYANAFLNMNDTTNFYQLEFFVNTFDPNFAIWNIGGQPAEAFTDQDHYGDYEGTLVVTATYN